MEKGLYVHIPFCDHICGYCDFARGLYKEDLANNYLIELEKEMLSKDLSNLKTIYIGGGTPTALNMNQLETLFKVLKPYSKDVVEYTIEANPESLTKEKALLFKKYGLNRVSMGMQVTQRKLLSLIERQHTFDDVKQRVNILNEVGINNISVDLMYGIPTQTLADLKESLEKLVKLEITHVSLYALTIEPNSIFGKRGYKEAEADLDADMYEEAIEYLEQSGFNRYEISNFAKEGFESEHNKIYWRYYDFVGVGLNASGKVGDKRYTNTRNLQKYLNNEILDEVIILSLEDQMFEFIMMNLRLSEGFKIKDFNKRFNVDFIKKYEDQVCDLEKDKLIYLDDKTIKASDYGLEILHNVIERFMGEV